MGAVFVGARDGCSKTFFNVGNIAIKDATKVTGDQEMFFPNGLDFTLIGGMLDSCFEKNYR